MENEKRETYPRVRLFLGVPISVRTMENLGESAESMRRAAYTAGYQIRWVPPINYHVTLAFLGDTHAEIVGAITDRLAPRIADIPRFEFTTQGMGGFPKLERARVLWAGVDDPAQGLSELARVCADELEQLGFPREAREFHPHVTIGRIKRPDDFRSVVAPFSERSFSRTSVDFVVLFESVIKSGIPEYVPRARYELAQGRSSRKRQTKPLQPSSKGASGDVSNPPDTAESEAASTPDQ